MRVPVWVPEVQRDDVSSGREEGRAHRDEGSLEVSALAETFVDVDSELEAHLSALAFRKWLLYYFPDRKRPKALAALRWYPSCVDVVQIFGPETAVAYRTPRVEGRDWFNPAYTVWSFGGRAAWVIRAALILRHPDHELAPRVLVPAPAICVALPMLLERNPNYVLRMPDLPNGNSGSSVQGAAKTHWLGPEA